MIRILFVCMGNICRSPTAEGVLRAMAKRAGLSSVVEVDSAGTHASEGDRPDPRASKVAIGRGYDISDLRARRANDQDFYRFDLILAMDQKNLAFLRRSCPPELWSKLVLFLEYANVPGMTEVPDPYFGSAEGFEKVFEICELAAQGLLERIDKVAIRTERRWNARQ